MLEKLGPMDGKGREITEFGSKMCEFGMTKAEIKGWEFKG